jgi:hypothetical protein
MSALASTHTFPEVSTATARAIKQAASDMVSTEAVRIWIKWDEQGTWETRAKELFTAAQDGGMQDAAARDAAATMIAYEACIAYAYHLGRTSPDAA